MGRSSKTWMMPRPPGRPDVSTRQLFDRLLDEVLAAGPGSTITYRLEAPLWQFLCHVGDERRAVLHGSSCGTIAEFEPRQPADLGGFGAQKGVFATTDGIWPLFYAVLDRDRYHGIMVNACAVHGDPGRHGYYFSLDPSAVDPDGALGDDGWPWRPGWVYLLPPTTFTDEPTDDQDGVPVASAQCISTVPVVPLARIAVRPSDFPFRDRIQTHDDQVLIARSVADPTGFPWLDDTTADRGPSSRPSAAEVLARALGTAVPR